MTTAYHDSTEESESDVGEGNMLRKTNAFGEPKTTRHSRPPRPKKLLEKREKIATRKSKRIIQMHAAKKEVDKVDTNIPHKFSLYFIILITFKIFSTNIRQKYSAEIFERINVYKYQYDRYVYVFQVLGDKATSKHTGGKGTKRKPNSMQSNPPKKNKK